MHQEALTAEQVAAAFTEDVGALVALRGATVSVSTVAGTPPVLPPTVLAEYERGVFEAPVTWSQDGSTASATAWPATSPPRWP